jgi:hypothetical protein
MPKKRNAAGHRPAIRRLGRLEAAAEKYSVLLVFIRRAEAERDKAAAILRRAVPPGKIRFCGRYLIGVTRIPEHRVPAHMMPETFRLRVNRLVKQ